MEDNQKTSEKGDHERQGTAIDKQTFEVEEGHYDDDNFYVLKAGGYYDPDGYYFDKDGVDEYGGKYDVDGFYAPSLDYEAQYFGTHDIELYADYAEHVYPVIDWLKK
jgi:hypothetical protein